MKTGKYTPGIFALMTSVILVIASSIAISYIYAHEKTNIRNHVLTRLDSISGLIDLWSNDFRSGAYLLAEDPKFTELIANYLEGRVDQAQANILLDQWFRPIYLSRGYEGHSIISTDYKVLLASSPAYAGKPVASAVSKRAIKQALEKGVAIGHISKSVYAVRDIDGSENTDVIFQLGCARISRGGKVLGVLCLRQNPYRKFFAMMATGFSGETGEAYAIDKDANIISPTRFDPIKTSQHPKNGKATLKNDLQARAPIKNSGRRYSPDLKTEKLITKAVQLALTNGTSDYIDNYPDYRGIQVVGAAKWIPELEMGIVIEQDVSEVYGPYQFSRRAIILLTGIAILLINILTLSLIHSRKKLAIREEHMRAFLDNFPGVAHMRDLNGKFLIANKLAEVAQNSSLKKLLGSQGEYLPFDAQYLHQMKLDHETVIKTAQPVISTRQAKNIFNLGYEWIKTIRFPVFDVDGRTVNAVGTIVQDITEQVRGSQELEEIRLNLEKIVEQRTVQLESARKDAEQAAQTKANFMANMSHELRTPMNAIIGLSHLATLVSDDPKLRGYLERIHLSSNHLLSIINDILDFSKIEAGKMTIDEIEFSVEDLIDKVVGFICDKATEKKLELLVKIDDDVPVFLMGDPLRIGQILINFSNNAVKFTESGEVFLRVRKLHERGDSVTLSFEVADTGIGISEKDIEQLFKPFHQLDTSLTRRFEGTGLGLAISKNLVEQMGGKVNVKSQPNKGSLFSIELTLKKSSDSTLSLLHSVQSQSLRDLKALVLCSNRSALTILDSMFESLAVINSQAETMQDALKLLKGSAFDFIFIYDPTEASWALDCAKKISALQLDKRPKILLVKANDNNNIDLEDEHLFDATLFKPVLLSNLVDALTGVQKAKKSIESIDDNASRFSGLRNCSILLVDDNEINQDVAKELLGTLKIQISVASNGFEALEKLDHQVFDIVLMDVQMPGMDGYETTARIRAKESTKNIPIIAMTANALDGDREKCLRLGMNDYISKPIVPQTLFETLLKWFTPKEIPTQSFDANQHSTKQPETINIDWDQLALIESLDLDAAVHRLLDNRNFYLSLLKKFVATQDSIADSIEQAALNKDFEQASRLAHSFKSLAGTIGAVELQTLALQLEKELNETQFNPKLTQELRAKLTKIISDIQQTIR